MTSTDLQQFSIDELTGLIDDAKALLEVRMRERKARAMAQARTILEDAGVSPRELARAKVEKKPGFVVRQGVTYVNPENPGDSWTAGKGRRPKWLSALVVSGATPVDTK